MDANKYESVVASFATKLAKSDKKSLVDLAARALTAIAARDAEIDELRRKLARYESADLPHDRAAIDAAKLSKIMANFKDTFPVQVQAAVNASAYWTKKTGAQKAAKASHENRPKQQAKNEVRQWWEKWQADRTLHPSNAAFALVVMESFDILKSARVIEGWCTEWKREAIKRT